LVLKMPREPVLRNTCHGPRTSLPQRVCHSTNHVQQNISPNRPTRHRLSAKRPQNMPITPHESIAGHWFSYNRQERHCGGVVAQDLRDCPPQSRLALPWPAHAVPRSSPLFAPRPRNTWVSLRTARQVVKPNVEELRARPAHKDHWSGAGARDAGRPDPQLWCARAHTQAPSHRDACGRLTRNLRSCPTLRFPPRPVLPL